MFKQIPLKKQEVEYDMKNKRNMSKKRKKVSIWSIMPVVMVVMVVMLFMKDTLLFFQRGLNFSDGGCR